MKSFILLSGAALSGLFLAILPCGAQTWNFDSNDQGWVIHDLNGSGDYINAISTYAADFHPTGGSVGGFISGTDRSGGSFFFQAPAAALGDYSMFIGGKLNFSLTTDQSVDFTDDSVVVLRGGPSNVTIVAAIAPLPDTNWTSYSLDLTAANFHAGNLAGSLVSWTDLSDVLGNLTDVSIDGEFHNGISETTGLDSVSFVSSNPGSAVPEASTYGLFASLGLFSIISLRRRVGTDKS